MAKRILVVDDSPAVRDQMRRFLEHNGFEVHEAENGQVGLDKAERLNPDLILTDLNMPVMGGLEMLRILQERGHTSAIFVLTTEASKSVLEQAKRDGANAWMRKPFHPQALLAGIRSVLG